MIAFYDLEVAPLSFDILQFLTMAQAVAGDDYLHVVIVPGTRNGWKPDDHKPIDDAERSWRVMHVLAACCRAAGVSFTLAPSRDFAASIEFDRVYPIGYTVESPKQGHYFARAVRALKTGFVPRFRATNRAREHAERLWGRGFVTVTLRNTHTKERNSSPDWLRASGAIAQDRRVVIIPDTADIGREKGAEYADFAALDFDLRLAAYELAALNMAASGGPFVAAVFTGLPYVWFHEAAKPPAQSGEFFAIPQFMAHHGFPVGSQFNGHGQPWRRVVWEPDTYDNIMSAYREAVTALSAQEAA